MQALCGTWADVCTWVGASQCCGLAASQCRKAKHLSPKLLHAWWGRAGVYLSSFQPGFWLPKGSDYNWKGDAACPESLTLLAYFVPKGFTLCSAKFLAKLLLTLTKQVAVWMPLYWWWVSCSRDLGSGSNLEPTLMVYAFCTDFQGAVWIYRYLCVWWLCISLPLKVFLLPL